MDYTGFPRCTVDYPMDLTAEELGSLSGPVNTLLKSNYLLGSSPDLESNFQSLFDLAHELVDIDCCAYISWDPASDSCEVAVTRHVTSAARRNPALLDPALIARHFQKPVLLDAKADERLRSYCAAWEASSLAAFPVRKGRDFSGAIIFGKTGDASFSKTQVKLLWVLAMQAENLLFQSDAVKSLSFYSFYDPLTRLYNRRYFDTQIEKEIVRSWRSGNPFTLLMLDIDGFKNYNDRFLHTSGDIALQELAEILRGSVREVDTVARFGGDEFAIILAESSAEGARGLATRLVDAFRSHMLLGEEGKRTERGSLSVGVATFLRDAFDKQSLLGKADRALYAAKRLGGGKVCLFEEVADIPGADFSSTDVPIQKVFDAARSVVNMDKFLEILLFTSMQGLSAERGSIVVPAASGDFALRATIGFSNGEKRFAPGSRVSPGPVTSWVVDHREPLVVSGQKDSPLPEPLRKNGYASDSFLSVPLMHEEHLLGILHLTNRRDGHPFTTDDLAAFRPIAAGIASILHKGIEFRESVKSFSLSILQSLSNALELRYPFLSGHGARVRDIAVRVGGKLGLGDADLGNLATAAELHDIGIIGIPGRLLVNTKKFSDQELEATRKHPSHGSKILVDIPGLDEIRRLILEHHEFYNGTGYPNGLKGTDISLGGRILALAEFYDSITSERPHRGGLRPDEAVQIIKNGANRLFDGEICRVFVDEAQAGRLLLAPPATH